MKSSFNDRLETIKKEIIKKLSKKDHEKIKFLSTELYNFTVLHFDKLGSSSEKATKIIPLLKNFGCYSEHVAKVLSILLDEELPITYKKYPHIKYLALVPTGNDNSHNYVIDEPCIAINNGGQAIRFYNGKVCIGNVITDSISLVRPASVLEIEEFLHNIVAFLDTDSNEILKLLNLNNTEIHKLLAAQQSE